MQPRGDQAPAMENMLPLIVGEDIITIAGGPHLAGTSRGSQKRYVNKLKTHDGTQHIPETRAPKH